MDANTERPIGRQAVRRAAGRGALATISCVLLLAGDAQPGSAGPRVDERPGPAAMHEPPGHRPPPPIHELLERHANRLGIAADVVAEIASITERSRREGDALRDRLHALNREMHELLSAETPDEPRVMEQAERIGLLEIEARQHRLANMIRVRRLLTEKQRQELVEIHQEELGNRRPPGPPGPHPAGFGPPPGHGPPPGERPY